MDIKEYRFRGYDRKTGEWMTKPEGVSLFTIMEGLVKEYWEENVDISIGTRIKDIFGKEIFYNDIVRFFFQDKGVDSYGGTAIITESLGKGAGIMFDYDTEGSPIVHASLDGGIVEGIWDDPSLWNIQIIGNIYENKDLIKLNETKNN